MLNFLYKGDAKKDDITTRGKLVAAHQASLLVSGQFFTTNVLTTERCHPDTTQLSQWAVHNLPRAISVLQQADIDAISLLLGCREKIAHLQSQMQETLLAGRKIFVSGCGSAGRSGYLVDYLLKESFSDTPYVDAFVPLLAGGDASLVKAAEGFEDNGGYGVKQLLQAGWQDGDLFIGLTASGSAKYVHSQLTHAALHGSRKPFFMYCNTDDEVRTSFATSPIFTDPNLNTKIEFLSIYAGPMALEGSTRMQAATAQILGISIPLFDAIASITSQTPYSHWDVALCGLIDQMLGSDYEALKPFIEAESESYQQGCGVYYEVSANIALNTSTDTSERSPTFNLPYFENDCDAKASPSICRTIVTDATDALHAYQLMLNRDPAELGWDDAPHTQMARILGWDLSRNIVATRERRFPDIKHDVFRLCFKNDTLSLDFGRSHADIALNSDPRLPVYLQPLLAQTLIKTMLNTLSTCVMGRLGFYEGNLMVNVVPSNLKLVSRGMRLTQQYNKSLIQHQYPVAPIIQEAVTQQRSVREHYLLSLMAIFYEKMQTLTVGTSIVRTSAQALAEVFLVEPTRALVFKQFRNGDIPPHRPHAQIISDEEESEILSTLLGKKLKITND